MSKFETHFNPKRNNLFSIHTATMQASDDNNNRMNNDMQEGSDNLDVAGLKSSTLPILNHIKGRKSDKDNINVFLITTSYPLTIKIII